MTTRKPAWSPYTQSAMERAGWFAGRDVGERVEQWRAELMESDGFVMSSAAERCLREFGGLDVKVSGTGQRTIRIPFEIDPLLGWGERDRFDRFVPHVGSLYPLGEVMGGEGFLAIAEDGRVFFVQDELWFVGASIEEAIEVMAEGKEIRPPIA